MKIENKQKIEDNINNLPLFDYAHECEKNDKRPKERANFSINKYYINNFLLFFGVVFSIIFMFYMQFKVDNMQSDIAQIEKDIYAYESEINILEIEWTYLTRPERLRILAKKYIKNTDNIISNQVKDIAQLEQYYSSVSQRLLAADY